MEAPVAGQRRREEEGREIAEVMEAVRADWGHREFIQTTQCSVDRMFHFLQAFETATRSKIASMEARVTTLERQLTVLESHIPPLPSSRSRE